MSTGEHRSRPLPSVLLSFLKVLRAREELPKALGSKTALGEYAKEMARGSGMGCFDASMVRAALRMAAATFEEGEEGNTTWNMELLEMVKGHWLFFITSGNIL